MATILVVDDRPANREYLVALLCSTGHRLLVASDGVTALQSARLERPDLIISDILMPNMDGFALVRELRADLALDATPVIFFTAAYLETEARKLAQACGVQQILIKPMEAEVVLQAVQVELDKPKRLPFLPLTDSFTREHLHLVTNKLYQKIEELETTNIRLAQRTLELARANSNLQNLSLTDELTGLYNRRGFFQLASRQLKLQQRMQRRLCVFFLDVDNMKAINDRLGHHAGDQALMQVGTVLRHTFRASDVIGRIGGDEFAVLAIDASEESDQLIQARLQSNLDLLNDDPDVGYELSLSMGATWIEASNQRSVEELLTDADAVMYVQKQKKQRQKVS